MHSDPTANIPEFNTADAKVDRDSPLTECPTLKERERERKRDRERVREKVREKVRERIRKRERELER